MSVIKNKSQHNVNMKLAQGRPEAKELMLYTDGSAIHNGKPDCKAAYAVYCPDGEPACYTGRVRTRPSNQRAELVAIDRALELAGETPWTGPIPGVNDSMYAINAITKWARVWEKSGWLPTHGAPVKHK